MRGVKKYYYQKVKAGQQRVVSALDHIDLDVYEGRINGLMGKSGSGKSTLARILMGLEKSDAGDILYKGRSLAEIPVKSFRSYNRIMFQNPYLSVNPYFKIRKIISEPLRIAKVPRLEIESRMLTLLEILKIDPRFLNDYPRQLSGGQLQRVVLARALIGRPEFVILDEPFSSLDDIMAHRLIRHFKALFRQYKVGALYISHHPDRIRFMADYISVIDKGRIIAHTSREDNSNRISE